MDSGTSGSLPIGTGTATAYAVPQAGGSQQPTLLPQPLPPQQNFIINLFLQAPQYFNQHPQLVGVPTNQYLGQPVVPYMMPMQQFQPQFQQQQQQQGVVRPMTYPPHVPYYSSVPLYPTYFPFNATTATPQQPPVFAHVQPQQQQTVEESQISNTVPTSQNPHDQQSMQGNNNAGW